MSFLWNLTSSFSKKFKSNSQTFTISTKEGETYNTISSEEKYRNTKTKGVKFNDIEIIDVESYKHYNKLDELYMEENERGCMKRCGQNCKCELF